MKNGFEAPNVIDLDSRRREVSYFDYKRQLEEKHANSGPDFLEGHEAEIKVLGECQIDNGEKIDRNALFMEMIDFARDHQPEEKSSPLQWIEQEISKKMKEEVTAYTAVGSPLDYEKGVDGFFEADNQIITFDYTMGSKENKERKGSQANLIFELNLNDTEEEKLEAVKEFVSYASGYIARTLEDIREYTTGERIRK